MKQAVAQRADRNVAISLADPGLGRERDGQDACRTYTGDPILSTGGPPRLDDYGEVLTPEQARRVLGIGRNTMYEAIHTGRVTAVRFGRRLLIPREQLRRLLGG